MAYFFQLPIITDLTIEQQAVLKEQGSLAVFGGPGTGKSVVALWRHIQNWDMNRRYSLLLTYTKSLEAYLKSSASSVNKKAGDHISRTYWWTYHKGNERGYGEILIDEAQDVELERYQKIKGLTPMVSYSADDDQSLYPNKSTTEGELKNLFQGNKAFQLNENFRNTKELVQFIRSIFPSKGIIPANSSGPKPSVVVSGNNNNVQLKIVREIIQEFQSDTHNIAILLPIKSEVRDWYNNLNSEFTCSCFTGDDETITTIENIHITTFKSAKGLEFDTVIIPNFDRFKRNIQNLHVVNEKDYYVVFTRARRNLILIDNASINNCDLPFLKNQISRSIVDVNLDYVTATGNRVNAQIDESDDLPF